MSIRTGLEQSLERIDAARVSAGRTDAVHLQLAVKTRSPEECREAAQLLADFGHPVLLGHNRVQEARTTSDAIHEVPASQLALIGPLQSNKINQALSCVDAIDSLDSAALAEKIDARAERRLPVLIQVNVSGEATKHGCAPDDLTRVVDAVLASQMLDFRGLMTVGLNLDNEVAVRAAYAQLRDLRDRAEGTSGIEGLELSMGMSGDIEWAIAEGATRVRLGTAVFGARNYT